MAILGDDREVTNPAARQLLELLDRGSYVSGSGETVSIRAQQDAAEAGARLYRPAELDALRASVGSDGTGPVIEVIGRPMQTVARDLSDETAIVLLNFASARNPGGGFAGGAKAQEEELCRCSGLYRTLLRQPAYYEANRAERSLLYTDHAIHSPAVPFVRLSAESPLLDRPFLASVITAPAPNAGAIRRNQPEREPEIEATFARRWANVLAIAEHQRHRTLVLGAWGCGAFRNDARMVATAIAKTLGAKRWRGAFDRVVFAIPDGGRSTANLDAFREVLGSEVARGSRSIRRDA
jgi:uncharacterized protein (TIGR02452 family)